jgi:hypothetical protein
MLKHSKINIFLVLSTVAIIFSGCASTQLKPSYLNWTFNEKKAADIFKEGRNRISGNALIRQSGGGVVTCAGNKIDLVPATNYAAERMQLVYRSDTEGYVPEAEAKQFDFQPDPIEYYGYRTSTTCDSQGNFRFEDVVDGSFYLVTKVVWKVGYVVQGGTLMKKVSVANESRKKVVLTP